MWLLLLQNRETDFKNAETCRPRSDLGRHFFADLNFDGFRGLLNAMFRRFIMPVIFCFPHLARIFHIWMVTNNLSHSFGNKNPLTCTHIFAIKNLTGHVCPVSDNQWPAVISRSASTNIWMLIYTMTGHHLHNMTVIYTIYTIQLPVNYFIVIYDCHIIIWVHMAG